MADDSPRCQHMSDCSMYELFSISGTLNAWQALYCTGEFKNCARYKKTESNHPVPANLMPNGTLLEVP